MKQGVLPLNVIISSCYLAFAAAALFVLKTSAKPLTKFQQHDQSKESVEGSISYDRLILKAWIKKYTLVGSCFLEDKKYLLKQFLFLSVYGVTCLQINHIIFWPVGLSSFLLLICFFWWDVILKKMEGKVGRQASQKKINAVNNQPESNIEIQPADIPQQGINTVNSVGSKGGTRIRKGVERSLAETLSTAGLSFAIVMMMLQTILILDNSISNSGELNIFSLLCILAIDQLSVRPLLGLIVWGSCKVFLHVSQINPKESSFICLLCSEEIANILIENELARIKKQKEMAMSPLRRNGSPLRVSKRLGLNGEGTYLHLLNMQATKRERSSEGIQQLYLTTAEKELFDGKEVSSLETRRKGNKENREIDSYSAQKGTTIDFNEKKECDDILILKDEPLNEVDSNHLGDFCLDDSRGAETRRRGAYRKKNKRNLHLTGNSPYLQYLPDMLKKVDKFKNGATKATSKIL